MPIAGARRNPWLRGGAALSSSVLFLAALGSGLGGGLKRMHKDPLVLSVLRRDLPGHPGDGLVVRKENDLRFLPQLSQNLQAGPAARIVKANQDVIDDEGQGLALL